MVIGLEVHVELATKTKIFCGCSTAFGQAPNTQICPVCTGMPGTLPVLNKKVVDYALAVGLALHCQVNRHCHFDRKNYFYPDNPQNYQISQLYAPICHDGFVEIETEEGKKKVRIHELHMEEDAGKQIHDDPVLGACSLVDYNRSGVPLIEIVSEPDMRSAREVIAYLEDLRTTIQYLGASDCRLQEGSMRVDVNLSVRKAGTKQLGTRTEMKNLNSFKAIVRAIEEEKSRQVALLKAGRAVVQETRRWDDDCGVSRPMRSKEDAQDYRYFPEPDLPSLEISEAWIEEIRKAQPQMRKERAERFQKEFYLPAYDALLLTQSRQMAEVFEQTALICHKPKEVSNWLMTEGMRLLKEKAMGPERIRLSPVHLAKLIELVENKVINRTAAKEVFAQMFISQTNPEDYIKEKGLYAVQDEDALLQVVVQVIADNPQSVKDFRNGKQRAAGFLVGQTMKAMKGKADPEVINRLVREQLAE